MRRIAKQLGVLVALGVGCTEGSGDYDFSSGGQGPGPGPGDDGGGGDGGDGNGDGGTSDDGGDGGSSDTEDGTNGGFTGNSSDSDGGAPTGDGGTSGDGGTTGDAGTTTDGGGGGVPGCGASWDFSDCTDDPWVRGQIGGAVNTWACGDPSGVGPPGPNTGMWGTNLAGNYGTEEGSYIEAPTFSLKDCAGSATMTVTHWYDFAGGAHCTPFCDGGVVYVSNNGGATWTYLTPTPNDYSTVWPIGSKYAPPDGDNGYRDSSGGWKTSTFNLSPYVGADQVSVRFILGGPALSIYPVAPGWYIDEVVVQ